jgi:nitrogen fixation/metabolism regulation signal transduction histidine kinase
MMDNMVEMAKQVAHEIKNPLTPMRLSIQHLQRSVQVTDDESRQKLERITKSLIEQIDALTQIANEFSHFAKMPKAQALELNLTDVVRSAASVFGENNGEFELELNLKGDAWIVADKDQLIRVFNNLIKNAIQAVGGVSNGKVLVSLYQKSGEYVVEVRDNGVGIAEDEKANIFMPYFTTKSTGTGLGLAMSKQIVEAMNGEIWFESKPGEGTSFFVAFDKAKS